MQKLPKLAKDLNISAFEYEKICTEIGREPNDFEIALFSAMWSEHCGYKHSRKLLSTLYKKGAVFCDENAGGIELGEYTVVFKIESHNHPCAVEPFNGAATGVGGIIRDVLAMNARPIAIMNSLKFGPLKNSEQEAKNRWILDGVVDGISSYGNCIGVPNIGGETEFLTCYDAQPIVNAMAVGLVKNSELVTSKSTEGLSIVLLGSRTGRDGLGGAAFASKELESSKNDGKDDRLSVQIADPFTKKKLIEATLEILNLDGVMSCQDCGAAGILSSTSEMGYKSSCGIELYLDRVHTLDDSITPLEIMLSESQERMVFTVDSEVLDDVFDIAKKYELDISEIGKTVDSGKYELFYNDKLEASLPYDVLAKAPLYDLAPQKKDVQVKPAKPFNKENIQELIDDVNFCSKKYVYEQYDHTVQGRNVIAPEKSAVAGLWLPEVDKVLGFSMDSHPTDVYQNPYQGTYDTLLESYKNLISAGFIPRGITNCLNFANPEKADIAYQFTRTIQAMRDFCELFDVPIVSGNVSFYNECDGKKIYPTPTISMMGVANFENIINAKFEDGDDVYLIGSLGGFNYGELARIQKYLHQQNIKSCANITRGGVFGSLFRVLERSGGADGLGFCGNLNFCVGLNAFEKYPNCFLVSVNKGENNFPEDIEARYIGTCNNSDKLIFDDIELSKSELYQIYRTKLNTLISTSVSF